MIHIQFLSNIVLKFFINLFYIVENVLHVYHESLAKIYASIMEHVTQEGG